ncbi:F0F1 ATP synthase subunit delta [Nocardioides halotolerans]|jgi:F-type H+-transporting ATPase subunit delta|uniref:F0F1 ATP synthase subunit delta n=1 Tax=Nocardioides halotolerans TaxID=433660 RepID=UPI0003F9E2D1|nr:F0F1 ATP synthase subunit delta [Nocardioides halotolerans]
MLRGASAEARKDLIQRMGDSGALDETAVLGAQLLAVAAVLRAQPALRRICTDASLEAEAKVGLANDVFSSKLDDRALDVARTAVQERWTSPADLADVLEELGIQALVRSAGAAAPQVTDELFSIAQMVVANPELREALSDRSRSDDDKCALLDAMLDGKVLPATLELVHLAEHSQLPIGRALEVIEQVAAGTQEELLAVVHTAKPLGKAEVDRLSGALSKTYAATVHLHVIEDSSLIGGLRVEIGDDVIDGSVAGRMADARRRLAG